jgi:hypothetical protein
MVLFAKRFCGGEWSWPFDIHEAAKHAVAHGDDAYWRDWLFLYEQTWRYQP